MKRALIVVDIQNDFCEGGSLAVAKSNEIFLYVNDLILSDLYQEIIFTQDFHPANHESFASNNGKRVGDVILLKGIPQVMWPNHCIQGTFGAEFHSEIMSNKATKIIQKGTDPEIDSYSAFFDNERKRNTGLSEYLSSKKITEIDVVGLALDYCVKYTCLDALQEGFVVNLHFRGTKAVNLHPNDEMETLYELIKKRVSIKA